jgi:hypothetical protein
LKFSDSTSPPHHLNSRIGAPDQQIQALNGKSTRVGNLRIRVVCAKISAKGKPLEEISGTLTPRTFPEDLFLVLNLHDNA